MKTQYATMTSKGQVTVPINGSETSLIGILSKPSNSLRLEEMDKVIKGMYDRRTNASSEINSNSE